MKSKQEVIQEAWGKNYEEFKENIDSNGWAIYPHFQKHEMIENIRPIELSSNGSDFRPKSLSGIENNNGWTRIESIDDIPKEITECYVFDDDGDICYYTFGLDSSKDYSEVVNGAITHWQPIIKPQAPIY